MLTKKSLLIVLILCTSNYFYAITDNEQSTSGIGNIITDVATMTDDIAEMIIVCKTEKDPKKIKSLISNIVKSIANIIESIIEKRKLKKLSRTISVHDFDFSEISSQSLEAEIEQIIYTILNKATEPRN